MKIKEHLVTKETIEELIISLQALAFIAETVAHLRGLEKEILPTTDFARKLIDKVLDI